MLVADAHVVVEERFDLVFQAGGWGFASGLEDIADADATGAEVELELLVAADACELATPGLAGDDCGGCGDRGAGETQNADGGDRGQGAGDEGLHDEDS